MCSGGAGVGQPLLPIAATRVRRFGVPVLLAPSLELPALLRRLCLGRGRGHGPEPGLGRHALGAWEVVQHVEELMVPTALLVRFRPDLPQRPQIPRFSIPDAQERPRPPPCDHRPVQR